VGQQLDVFIDAAGQKSETVSRPTAVAAASVR